MKMLVTKFSDGKYKNEGELFAEPISNENVKLMGEMIALQYCAMQIHLTMKLWKSYTTDLSRICTT